jgi:hypothetical protein
MAILAGAPYVAGNGTLINISGIDILPENLVDVRGFYPQSPERGGAFIFTEPDAPPLGTMGGTPGAKLPPAGSLLENGYRVIVEPGSAGMISLVIMFPE